MVKQALDPMFAPVPYSDDRQITRTRRGVACKAEQYYNPLFVYCRCESCGHRWIMDKSVYVTGYGTANNRPNPMGTKNVGIGGTGLWIGNFPKPDKDDQLNYPKLPADITTYFNYDPGNATYIPGRYKQYTHLAHDTSYCATTTITSEDGYIHTHDFYPLTGGTGNSGELLDSVTDLYYDPESGGLRGDKNSPYLGEPENVYSKGNSFTINNHPGGSGSYGGWYYNEVNQNGRPIKLFRSPLPRTFGGHPMACPNCCKVNFEAIWIEPNDRPPNPTPTQPGDIPSETYPPPEGLEEINQYMGWIFAYKLLSRYYFTTASTSWYVVDPTIFRKHVSLYVFDSNGNIITPDKIKIDHIVGSLRIEFTNSTSGYVWILRPMTELTKFEDGLTNICTAIIVRDFQSIKDHFQ